MASLRSRPWIATCGAAICAAVLVGATAPDEAEELQIDPQAEEVLRDLSDYFAGLDSFKMKASMDLHVEAGDAKGFKASRFTIVMERPDRFAFKQTSGKRGATVITDGTQLYTLLTESDKYVLDDTSPGFGGVSVALDMASTVTAVNGIKFISALIQPVPYDAIIADATKVRYVGTQKVKAKQCHHLEITEGDKTSELWIRTGDRPIVMRYTTDATEQMSGAGVQLTLQRTGQQRNITGAGWRVNFSAFKANGRIGSKIFRIKPKKKAEAFDSLEALAMSRFAFDQPVHSLVGKKAPKLTLSTPDGGTMKLADHVGKDVVVLDFWATWCGWCIKGFPDLIEVTASFKGRGVVVYAVNQGESRELVDKFLSQRKFDLNVLFDPKSKSGGKFKFAGLPHTVIIGKDGTIQAVHQGYSPDMKSLLTSELEKLIRGENLVETKSKKKRSSRRRSP